MAAGESARRAEQRARLLAQEYERRLLDERARAENFAVASRTEAAVAQVLRPLEQWGWRLLEDRHWPGTRSANIDLILVGPGGVLVIDVKAWAEPDIVDGRLYRGQTEAQDELDKLLRQTEAVTDVVGALGLAPGEVLPVMVFVGQRGTDTSLGRVRIVDERSVVPLALRRGSRLDAAQVERLVQGMEDALPPQQEINRHAVPVVLPPVLATGRHTEPQPDTLFDVDAVHTALVAQLDAAPVEEWMTFLHPEQQRLIRRVGRGPSRVRGAAGTGKTVVALHRTAYLAETLRGPVLFTTFVKTLPPVLHSLYARLSPTTAGDVTFVNLHKWATDLLNDRGHRLRFDPRGVDIAYSTAWGRHGKNSALSDVGVPWRYWQDEIDYVIKGRGITEFEDYAALRRVGRRTRLTAAHRHIVWDLYADYQTQLRERGVTDVNDLISLALIELQEKPLDEPFAAVVADEVQDLTCQAVRLLAEMSRAGERLLLVGDGQQQIYPGGYTLTEAGLAVGGRSTVLRVNYRNGAQIIAAASDVVAGDEYEDLDDGSEVGRREVQTARDGGQVWNCAAPTVDALRSDAVRHIQQLIADGHELGGIAILCLTNDETKKYSELLARNGIASIPLTKYCGVPTDAVKVGTVQRAKGLEFKHVVHPVGVTRPTNRAKSAEAQREESERAHRTLFVAMTRARDSVWVGRVASDEQVQARTLVTT